MKEYELPDKWYIKVTDENYDILNDYRKNIVKYEDGESDFDRIYPGMYIDGSGGDNGSNPVEEITTDQFIQYVLKQNVFPKNWAIRQNACQEACDWFNNNTELKNTFANLGGRWQYITFQAKYSDNLNNYIEITKEQFIKHVLKTQKPNYSKLINILKFIDGSSRM